METRSGLTLRPLDARQNLAHRYCILVRFVAHDQIRVGGLWQRLRAHRAILKSASSSTRKSSTILVASCNWEACGKTKAKEDTELRTIIALHD